MEILLKQHMKKYHLPVRQVSILTGISKSEISKIMNGQVSPSLDTMEKLAAGLRVGISDLYDSDFK